MSRASRLSVALASLDANRQIAISPQTFLPHVGEPVSVGGARRIERFQHKRKGRWLMRPLGICMSAAQSLTADLITQVARALYTNGGAIPHRVPIIAK